MIVTTKNPGMAQFMKMKGAEFIGYTLGTGYTFESKIKRNEWRSAYLNTDYPEYTSGVSEFINLSKEAD